MVVLKTVSAKKVLDSRKEYTIKISITTDFGKFSASSPNGKSTGKFEAKPYKKSLEEDIIAIKSFRDYFSKDILEKFEDLRRIEDIVKNSVGANTLFALESAVLKALSKEKKKEIWQLINPNAKKFPRLVGNCVGGGLHSELLEEKRPDFQEFHLIPKGRIVKSSFEKNLKDKKSIGFSLKEADKNFNFTRNDENAWRTSLNEKEVLEVLKKTSSPRGIDVAASSFYKRKKYHYQNPKLDRTVDEQIFYISNLIENFNLQFIEDPFDEEDFESFSKLLKRFPDRLIVGDDLTVTNKERLKKAIELKSINAIIIKPNQTGSLLDVRDVCKLAKEKQLKLVFSHRSGETGESILADLCFGFEGDFFKSGITGKVREVKIKRLIQIQKSLKTK